MTISKQLIIALVLGAVLTILADLLLEATGHAEAKLWGSHLVGYWAAFGLVWYLIIVVFSKLMGRYWLERREGYYERQDDVRDE